MYAPADDDVVRRARIQRDGLGGASPTTAACAVVVARDGLGRAARRGHQDLRIKVGLLGKEGVEVVVWCFYYYLTLAGKCTRTHTHTQALPCCTC